MKKIIAGALIGGAAAMGMAFGAGHADAKINSAEYRSQTLVYGFIPTPESNVRVVGNTMYSDYYGLGPQNLTTQWIVPTKHGGNASAYGTSPIGQWFTRTEFQKSRGGYFGTTYIYGGIPIGNILLMKSPPRANMPR